MQAKVIGIRYIVQQRDGKQWLVGRQSDNISDELGYYLRVMTEVFLF